MSTIFSWIQTFFQKQASAGIFKSACSFCQIKGNWNGTSSAKDIQFQEVKDTISQLNMTIHTQNNLIVSLQKMIQR